MVRYAAPSMPDVTAACLCTSCGGGPSEGRTLKSSNSSNWPSRTAQHTSEICNARGEERADRHGLGAPGHHRPQPWHAYRSVGAGNHNIVIGSYLPTGDFPLYTEQKEVMSDKDLAGLFKAIKPLSKGIAVFGLSLTLHFVAHSEPVKVFGLPLGGTPARPLKICPQDLDNRPSVCWIDKPFVGKDGSRFGSVSVPNKDLPQWAAYKMMKMTLTPKGRIASLTVKLDERCDVNGIASSIAARFDKATVDRLHPPALIKIATWELKDIFIHLEMAGSHCSISFRTPEDIAEQRAYNDSQKVSRPLSP